MPLISSPELPFCFLLIRSSAAAMAMSFKNWRNSSSRETIHLGRNHLQVKDEKDEVEEAKPKWFKFWRKIYREKKKKKKFASGPVTLQASYDPDEYSQNFDQGTGWTEPDNHSRSFSARFADPSRILLKTSSVRYVQGL